MKRHLPVLLIVLPLFIALTNSALLPDELHPWRPTIAVVALFCVMAGKWLHEKFETERHPLTELPSPFEAEVLLNGHVVARLSDRAVTEMFWRDYKIEAVDEAGQKAINDNALWERLMFDFRDPKSGLVCISALAGGSPVHNGRVSIRSMYFPDHVGEALWKPGLRPVDAPPLTPPDVQKEAARWMKFLEGPASQHPALTWVPTMHALVKELKELAATSPLDAARITDFNVRFKQFTLENRIKGFDHGFWHVDALLESANETRKASAPT